MSSKTILHIDMNSYFATCAQIAHPEYMGKPVAVGAKNSKSIISTASYEARAYGVKSAMPIYQAKALCPELIVVEHDFKMYEEYTYKFVNIVKKYADKVELASIDECYADITEHLKSSNLSPIKYISNIQKEIYETTGLKCSIGVAPNKFLAKMGSDYKKPMGITVFRKRDVKTKLWPIKIEDMFGVGKKTASYLKGEFNIKTIGDFATLKDPTLKKKLGKGYDVLISWAYGDGDDNVSEEYDTPKSIGNQHTMYFETNEYSEIIKNIKSMCESVSKRAIKEELYGNSVAIVLKYNDFKSVNREVTLDFPFNDEKTIYAYAIKLLDANYDENRNLRLVGVTLRNVAPLSSFVKQLSIFDKQEKVTINKTQAIIDRINAKLGKDKLTKASKIRGGKK